MPHPAVRLPMPHSTGSSAAPTPLPAPVGVSLALTRGSGLSEACLTETGSAHWFEDADSAVWSNSATFFLSITCCIASGCALMSITSGCTCHGVRAGFSVFACFGVGGGGSEMRVRVGPSRACWSRANTRNFAHTKLAHDMNRVAWTLLSI